jgi:hypothetical protein
MWILGMCPSAPASGAANFGPPDWTSLGLVLSIVGSLLIANGILFRTPKGLVAERLGHGPPELRRIREFVFHRVQMTLGFLFLVAGFAAQLYGRAVPSVESGGSPALWVGGVVLLAIALEVGGWWWSLHSLRGHVRAHLREYPPDFETDTNLAREVGELFGVESTEDETVQSYAGRLRSELGLAPPRTSGLTRAQDRRRVPQPSFGEELDVGAEEF